MTNDDLAGMLARVERGDSPRHQMWGLDALQRDGWSIEVVARSKENLARRISRLLRLQFGDLQAQWRVLRRARGAAAILALEPSIVRGFGLLRRLRILRTPLVVIAHPGRPSTVMARAALRGADSVVALSQVVGDYLVEAVGRDRAATHVAWWGAALDYPRYRSTGETGVVAAGRTHRDHELLLGAVSDLDESLTIVVRSVETNLTSLAGDRVRWIEAIEHAGIVAELAGATVVAIPLARADGTFGLTELTDALALGKPVVMTENPFIDVDLRAAGAGLTVPRGDAVAFREALALVLGDPEVSRSMSTAARRLAEEHDYDRFAEILAAAVNQAAIGRKR